MAFLNKHIIKVLIAFFIVLFFIFASSNDSQAVYIANTRLTTDIAHSLRDEYNDRLNYLYWQMYNRWNSLYDWQKQYFKDLLVDYKNYFIYVDLFPETYQNKTYYNLVFRVYDITDFSYSFSDNVFLIYYDDNSTEGIDRFACGTYTCKLVRNYVLRNPILASTSGYTQFYKTTSSINGLQSGDNIDIWQPFFMYYGDFDVFSRLVNSVNNDFKYQNISDIALLINAISENTKETKDSTKELTDFVKNDNINSSSSDFNTDSGVGDNNLDIGVNNIFNQLYNTISNWEESTLRLPFPNTNQYIEINSATLRGDIAGAGGSVLILIIQSFWLFIVGRYILKDVLKYYEQLKSGDIVKSSETNIKADML